MANFSTQVRVTRVGGDVGSRPGYLEGVMEGLGMCVARECVDDVWWRYMGHT